MREPVIGIGLDDAVRADELAHLAEIFELGELCQVVEQSVVPRLYVVELLSECYVEDGTLAHRIVQSNLDEERSFADAGACHDDAELSGAQTTFGRALQNPERALFVDLLSKHYYWSPSCLVLALSSLAPRASGATSALGSRRRPYSHKPASVPSLFLFLASPPVLLRWRREPANSVRTPW